jgi:hypothetical protein
MFHPLPIVDAPEPLPGDSIGATVVFIDRGVYGFIEKRERVGVITGQKYCRITGQHFLVSGEGFNLPHLVHQTDIVSFCHPSVQESKTATAAVATIAV